ncbi:RmlC-like cupins superfamily protein [Medicago truncatula]|uniref:RmlC-like cupins superfamily protein n=1 Tax=Medicago truncatula TaxID=3880 RepID=G7KMX6_MEDTR|nr:RmlC-like cupins superfamily protein [Medicago truncatula]
MMFDKRTLKWGCPPNKFPWTYDFKVTCYLLEGKVKVTPNSNSVEFSVGDLLCFLKG